MKEISLSGNVGPSRQWSEEGGVNDSSLWFDIRAEKKHVSLPGYAGLTAMLSWT